jgi:F0F1-type ATP synthase membrane subunit c/vacuolar-type H+-ATPase subunit K
VRRILKKDMLEGAKSIGAGAATIASAGAAIGIGNVFSSLIHSVARNPSLSKRSFYLLRAIVRAIVFLPLLGNSVEGFFGRFLGSEGTAGRTLLLLSILGLCLVLLFNLNAFRWKKRYGFLRVFFFYILIYLWISILLHLVKMYFLFYFVSGVKSCLFLILCVGGEQALPAPSDPSSSSSWREDSFGIDVLLEPFSETESESRESNSLRSSIPRASRDEAGPSQPATSYHEWVLANERFSALLARHLQKHAEKSAVMARYPQLREADFHHLGQKMAQSFYIDVKSPSEIEALAASEELRTYTKSRSSLESFLDSYYSEL